MTGSRQKLLLAGLVAMGLLAVGERIWRGWYEEPLAAADKRVERLNADIAKAKQNLRRLKKDEGRLQRLRSLSLPDDVEVARTVYQAWLTQVAESIELEGQRVDSNPPRSQQGFQILPFSLRGTGSLEQLTALLFEFYQAPYLHHVRTLTVTPVAGARELNLNLAVEALIIGGAQRTEEMPAGSNQQLASAELDAYQAIARRNFFSASGGVEATAYTTLTAIVEVDRYPEAWFTNHLEDEVVKVREGDRFRVGSLACEVERITLRDAIITIDGQRWLLTVHDRVADAVALPPEY
jgi:Tfp pilus assembly protein PilO